MNRYYVHACKFVRVWSFSFTLSHKPFPVINQQRTHEERKKAHLELSSNKNELLTALLESSVISTLMLEITCKMMNMVVVKNKNHWTTIWIQILQPKKISSWTNLHLEIHFGYYSCHPNREYIFYTAVEHSGSEETKNCYQREREWDRETGERLLVEWECVYVSLENMLD